MKYRTIVTDPPWRYKTSLPPFGLGDTPRSVTPYPTMTVEEICALPIGKLAADDTCHLYLWTTNTHIRHAWKVIESWGFTYSTLLVWCKAPRGGGGFPTYSTAAEYVLFCYRGKAEPLTRIGRNWWEWKRGEHSAKPENFIDMVETVSPAPRLEMFARRQRLGWDTWGNEALNHVSLVS